MSCLVAGHVGNIGGAFMGGLVGGAIALAVWEVGVWLHGEIKR